MIRNATAAAALLLIGLASQGVAQTPVATSAPQDRIEYDLPGAVKLVLRRVPAGTFQMGGSTASDRFAPRHRVTLTRDYYIGETEVTQAQWSAVMGGVPFSSQPSGPRFPIGASADDVDAFLGKVNALLGLTGQMRIRLPTEAEWERAMRAGTDTRFPFGDAKECTDTSDECAVAEPFAWWAANSSSGWHEVALKKPNSFELFDMLGNANELVQDWYESLSAAAVTDPVGPSGPTIGRLARGGSWRFGLRPEGRSGPIAPSYRDGEISFRLARSR